MMCNNYQIRIIKDFGDNMSKRHFFDYGMKLVVLVVTAVIEAVALNEFLIPNDIFAGGFNGIAQLFSWGLSTSFGINVSTGIFVLLFNIPIAIVGWLKIGPQFTVLSFLNSFLTSILIVVIPVSKVANNSLLAALFGGLLVGAGSGLTFRYGFSTAGMDIIAMVVQKTTGKSIGSIIMSINMVIVLIAGLNIGWNNAMYTVIGIYATSRVIDTLHTRHQKLTAFIVTNKAEELIVALHADLIRGITILPSQGAYTKRDSKTLMIVISRYELYELQQITNKIDSDAFVNLVSTVTLSGNFSDEDLQKQMRKNGMIGINK